MLLWLFGFSHNSLLVGKPETNDVPISYSCMLNMTLHLAQSAQTEDSLSVYLLAPVI